MKKQLVQAKDLDSFICRVKARIYVEPGMILTPGARDELSRRGVAVVHGSCPDAAACTAHGAPDSLAGLAGKDAECLLLGIAAMLQAECGITDPRVLKETSLQALRTIRENL